MGNDRDVDGRTPLWRALQALSRGDGILRESLVDDLNPETGELKELQKYWKLDLSVGPRKLAHDVWSRLEDYVNELEPRQARQGLSSEDRKEQYLNAVRVSFSMSTHPDLEGVDLSARRNWLARDERGKLKIAPSVSQDDLNHAISQIERQILAGYKPATDVPEADASLEADSVDLTDAPVNHAIDKRGTWDRLQRRPVDPTLAHLISALADEVRADIDDRLNGIPEVLTIAVRWKAADEPLVGYWHPGNATTDVIDLAGSGKDIVETFSKVPSGRLVVLGRPGAGKSVLALHFARALLDPSLWQPDVPVPVMLSLGSWQARKQSYEDWLVQELSATHPQLRARHDGQKTVARILVQQGHVLPVFDGFDEIEPHHRRGQIIDAFSKFLKPQDQLFMSSRVEDYADTIEVRGTPLLGAAVIELCDLSLDDITSYLLRTVPRVHEGGSVTTKWSSVFARLEAAASEPMASRLSDALSTPLMVSLAGSFYSKGDENPTELLDAHRFLEAHAIENHLLGTAVSVAYEKVESNVEHRPALRFVRRKKRYGPIETEDAKNYLRFLALYLTVTGYRVVSWWRMGWPPFTTRARRLLAPIALCGNLWLLLFIPVIDMLIEHQGVLVQTAGTPSHLAVSGYFGAISVREIAGISIYVPSIFIATFEGGPPLSRIGTSSRAYRQQCIALVAFICVAPLLCFGLGVLLESWNSAVVVKSIAEAQGVSLFVLVALGNWFPVLVFIWVSMLAMGLVYVVGFLTGIEFLGWSVFTRPSLTVRVGSSFDVLAAARRAWLIQSLLAIAGCLVGGILVVGWNSGIAYWPWALWVCISTPVLSLTLSSIYGDWLLLSWFLWLKGHLPRSALNFMEDAARRGILRRSGPGYRFRHFLLQYYLASEALGASKTKSTGGVDTARAYVSLASAAVTEDSSEMARKLLVDTCVLGSRDHFVIVDSLRVQLRLAVASRVNVGAEETERKIRAVLTEACDRLSIYERSPLRRRILRLTLVFHDFTRSIYDECDLVVEAWCSLTELLRFDGRSEEADEETEKLAAWSNKFIKFLAKWQIEAVLERTDRL